jgi:hypothetical protein
MAKSIAELVFEREALSFTCVWPGEGDQIVMVGMTMTTQDAAKLAKLLEPHVEEFYGDDGDFAGWNVEEIEAALERHGMLREHYTKKYGG